MGNQLVRLLLIAFLLLPFAVTEAKVVEYALPSNESTFVKYEKKAKSWFQKMKVKYKSAKKEAQSKWTSYFDDKKQQPKTATAKPATPTQPVVNTIPAQEISQNNVVEEQKQVEANKVEELKQTLPEAKQADQKQAFSNILTGAASVASQSATVQSTPGRAGTSKLPLNRSKVPYFSLKKKKVVKRKGKKKTIWVNVDKIPALDIGEEPRISRSDFTIDQDILGIKTLNNAKPLPNVPLISHKQVNALVKRKVRRVRKLPNYSAGEFGLGKVVSKRKIDNVPLAMAPEQLFDLKAVKPFTKGQLKMLKALILNAKGDKCHAVAGLFYEAAREKEFREEANFNLAICSQKMGFFSDATLRLVEVIKEENPEYAPEAIEYLLKDLPVEYEKLAADTLLNLKNKSLVSEKIKDRANFYLAKGLHKKKSFSQALIYAQKVSNKSEFYAKSLYIKGISQYSLGNAGAAEKSLEATRQHLDKTKSSDKELSSLVSINLARMKFRQNRFKEAHKDYAKIHKDTSLWVEGLIEQGWTQLQVADPEGAIGNMYSLHSPYFKAVYKPESYVVRSIGYINICQYGDAYRTLTQLERQHRPWIAKIDKYMGTNKKAYQKYYTTAQKYLRGNSLADVDGLPYQVIREMGRRRGFLENQESLNLKEDERNQFNFIHGFIQTEKRKARTKLRHARNRLAKIDKDLRKLKKDKSLKKFANQWRASRRNEKYLINYYKFELSTLEEGRRGFKKMRAKAFKRIAKEKATLKWRAGRSLKNSLASMNKNMKQFMENNEFLRYEVFSGSGENIRYQVAGGKVEDAKRVPANIKPKKIMNWDFDGEFWEDEIGSYRSSLTNNCPQLRHANGLSTGFKAESQAGM